MKIITVLGTRPEITKLAPLIPLLDQEFDHKIIHTGQHYDYNMDAIFFADLNLRKPDFALNIGSGSHAMQTAAMMVKIEEILINEKPDVMIVFADPNTPLAGTLVAAKLQIPLIHLEAGCRSFNKNIPEELNRIVCDHLSNVLLAPDSAAKQNLIREGLPEDKIHIVGSTAIESSLRNVAYAREKSKIVQLLHVQKENYILVTIHRAENTDDPEILTGIIESINEIAEKIDLVFPMHPRTKKNIIQHKLVLHTKIKVIEPQGYLDFLSLLDNCLLTISDSGGVQEEAAALNKPCLILRNETEWIELVNSGKNLLLGNRKEKIISLVTDILENRHKITEMKEVSLHLNTTVSHKIVEVIKREFAK